MLDHALGRPEPRYRKYQIFAVVALWSAFIYARPHGPKRVSRLSRFVGQRITIWQAVVLTCLTEYVRRNFKKLIPWLESPEPLADMYNRDYFRATWITTALDAGFWTAMRIRPNWLRHICSMLFTLYYLISADRADEMVRKVRGKLSLEHLRVSWNKGTTPILAFGGSLLRPAHLKMRFRPRRMGIPRMNESPYKEPIRVWLYYDGPTSELKNHDKVILDIPGGGFVAMNPRNHDDKLMAWAAKTGLPVVSIDYKKAPEYPYPYALNECFDTYYSIIASRGRLIGLSGESVPKIVIAGDSAGGNLAVATVLMMLQARPGVDIHDRRDNRNLPLPEALVLIYPALDVNMSSWLTDEQSALIKDPTRRKANKGVVKRLDEDYRSTFNTSIPLNDEIENQGLGMTVLKGNKSSAVVKKTSESELTKTDSKSTDNRSGRARTKDTPSINALARQISNAKPQPLRTRLEMTSLISYVDDRVLSPEMLRAMIILYLGENERPDFSTEYLLSPLRAPEELLREFPKVFMLTGERDPLSDDTVLFAGRLLEAHLHKFQARKETGLIADDVEFVDTDYVYYELVTGVSHGFLQFAPIYHRAYRLMETCSSWMKAVFEEADRRESEDTATTPGDGYIPSSPNTNRVRTPEDRPLEMPSLSLGSVSPSGRRQSGSFTSIDRRDASGKGRIKKPAFSSGRKSPVLTRNNRSLLNLTALDVGEVFERRMGEVVRPLNGGDIRPKTPK